MRYIEIEAAVATTVSKSSSRAAVSLWRWHEKMGARLHGETGARFIFCACQLPPMTGFAL